MGRHLTGPRVILCGSVGVSPCLPAGRPPCSAIRAAVMSACESVSHSISQSFGKSISQSVNKWMEQALIYSPSTWMGRANSPISFPRSHTNWPNAIYLLFDQGSRQPAALSACLLASLPPFRGVSLLSREPVCPQEVCVNGGDGTQSRLDTARGAHGDDGQAAQGSRETPQKPAPARRG